MYGFDDFLAVLGLMLCFVETFLGCFYEEMLPFVSMTGVN
jgi:hypothetical protein